jgi:prevent-host-death family protein
MYMLMYIQDMPRRYSLAEARSQLPTIVDEAEAGRTIELTRRGKPVAVVVSHREFERLSGNRPSFNEAYRTFLQHHSLEEIGLDARFATIVRDRSEGRKVGL